tara:strand:+ start:926 stop:1612 length:687 start_codon:yes stop_codon:yes gene_type:complete
MMLQLIDRRKIYLYLFLLLILLSIHNVNSKKSINNYFKIKKIILNSSLEDDIYKEISLSLDQFYNSNIFSINSNEITSILNNFNIISEYKIKKEFPSVIKIDLKETNILAYFFDNNQKTYLGENGKKIRKKQDIKDDLPLIVGHVDINNFLDLKKKLLDNGFKLNDFVKYYSFKSNRWDLLYKDKILVKLPSSNLDTSISLLKEIIDSRNINDIKIIDLRIKNRIILS